MGFFDRIKTGFELTKASLRIVRSDPEFLVLPVISGVIMLAILATFLLFKIGNDQVGDAVFWGFLAVYYLASFSLLYFIQAMVIEAARRRFAGENPTLGNTFGEAAKKLDKVIVLAAIASVVSIVSQFLRQKAGEKPGAGGLVLALMGSLLGVAWTVISYFSLPVILYENAGVFESFGRSKDLVKKTWGEAVAANVSTLLLYVPALAFLVLAFLVPIGPMPLVFLGLCVVSVFLAAIVGAIVKAVISQALYEYANTGKVPAGMPEGAVQNFYSR
ncbi:MAG: DUF6159 family protein [Candidatus Micrarchaeota archaeon]